MAAETNLIKSANLARVREVDFVERFADFNISKLLEILGISRMIPKADGTVLKTYKATGTLQSGTVTEGDTIPLSQYSTTAITYDTLTLNKWRKATSAEAINDKGYDQAVSMTNDKMLQDVQKAVRAKFFSFLAEADKTGTGVKNKTRVSAATFQATLAKIWGNLQTKFEDDTIDSVYFVNPLDVADYLSDAEITMQTVFGMSYIENFLGLGTIIMSSLVPAKTIYATAKENLVCYYIPVNGGDMSQAFNFTTDQTGLIGIHEDANYTNMTFQTVVVNGMVIFAERIDGVVVGTISASSQGGET